MMEQRHQPETEGALEEDLAAVERELAKLKPVPVSAELEQAVERVWSRPANPAPAIRGSLWRALPLATAACVGIVLILLLKGHPDPSPLPPGGQAKRTTGGGASDVNLLALRQALSRSEAEAMRVIDASGSASSRRGEPVLRAWNAMDVNAMLEGL